MNSQLLLIQLKLFLESWQLVDHLLLRVFQLLDDLSAPLLLLLNSKFEILPLRFQDLC